MSVGHSNLDLADLLERLQTVGVTVVADVRSSPFSRRLPQFNQGSLRDGLRRVGIAYVFLGEQLGGRPRDRGLYDDQGRADYEGMRATQPFRDGLERLRRGAREHRVAMLCGEEDPLDCHRGLLITPALVLADGPVPVHLRKDGRLETTRELEDRLLAMTGLADQVLPTLFDPAPDRAPVLAEAYRSRGRRVAFRSRVPESDRSGHADG